LSITTDRAEGSPMDEMGPAVVFPPGDYLLEILNDRGWSQVDFAEIIGRAPKTVNEIIKGKTSITPTTANEIAEATGTNALLWLNLETAYRLHRTAKSSPAIAQRAAIRQRVPLRLMVGRNWIRPSDDVAELKREVVNFLGVRSLEEHQPLAMAAKQTAYNEPLTPIQEVWLLRVKQVAETLIVPSYSAARLRQAVTQMESLLRGPDDVYQVPKILSAVGVRFVVVERLPSLKIDGVCFWPTPTTPVIGMSLTRDRIDNFWFVLRHEIEHVLNGDGKTSAIVDNDLDKAPNVSDEEQLANEAAADFCVPAHEMRDFIVRKAPLFSEDNIRRFADTIGRHPGLVAGQLRKHLSRGPMGERAWTLYTSQLARVRHVITETATTDGFGHTLNIFA